MIFAMFGAKRRENRRIVATIYNTLTEAARAPELYSEMGVPDTVMGRFEMVSAHMILFLRRCRASGKVTADLAQEIVDAFFEDLDHSIRELGIGDMGVPKRMKKFASMFYGRVDAYLPAIDQHDPAALAVALRRNVHPGVGDGGYDMTALASHLLAVADQMSDMTDEDILAGRVALAGRRADA